jgi:hypothetical protein
MSTGKPPGTGTWGGSTTSPGSGDGSWAAAPTEGAHGASLGADGGVLAAVASGTVVIQTAT